MRHIEQFVRLSKYTGERFDLVQAGGGNISLRLNDGLMLIKESGCSLSEVDFDKGYIKLKTQKVIKILKNERLLALRNKGDKDEFARKLLMDIVGHRRLIPSIEIFLHVLLYAYTLHTHPLVINAIVCRRDYKKILKRLFSNKIAFLDYKTPGIELALALQKVISQYQDKFQEKPKTIFLQNHGLIVSSDNVDECIHLLEGVLERIEKYLGIDLYKYKLTNRISGLVNSLENTHYVSYVSSDDKLKDFLIKRRELFFKRPFCPDGVVYCGVTPLEITRLEDKTPLIAFYKKYGQLPRIVIFKKYIYFVAQNIKKAKEIEDVLKFNLLTSDLARGKVNFLNTKEVKYLNSWKAETYRRKKD